MQNPPLLLKQTQREKARTFAVCGAMIPLPAFSLVPV
jgi:hypothetical protein